MPMLVWSGVVAGMNSLGGWWLSGGGGGQVRRRVLAGRAPDLPEHTFATQDRLTYFNDSCFNINPALSNTRRYVYMVRNIQSCKAP